MSSASPDIAYRFTICYQCHELVCLIDCFRCAKCRLIFCDKHYDNIALCNPCRKLEWDSMSPIERAISMVID